MYLQMPMVSNINGTWKMKNGSFSKRMIQKRRNPSLKKNQKKTRIQPTNNVKKECFENENVNLDGQKQTILRIQKQVSTYVFT